MNRAYMVLRTLPVYLEYRLMEVIGTTPRWQVVYRSWKQLLLDVDLSRRAAKAKIHRASFHQDRSHYCAPVWVPINSWPCGGNNIKRLTLGWELMSECILI